MARSGRHELEIERRESWCSPFCSELRRDATLQTTRSHSLCRALDLRRALDARTNASAHDTMAPPSTTTLRSLGSVSVFALLAAPAAAVPVAERRQLIESAAAGEMEFEAALRPVVNVISYDGVAGHTTFQLAVSSCLP